MASLQGYVDRELHPLCMLELAPYLHVHADRVLLILQDGRAIVVSLPFLGFLSAIPF